MSQLQVTGEAKIRDIQGPVVANNGVVTALDGAASQYVRGDGTLADFPTSTGGGSSVSYYLNSSVSQGTIGGVAYRQLSKEPIIGAGTDITISANGYVANYLTDANDPDVILVPGGNFNCEFYFSVNNNTGNPTTYAELYKYDGTTFTLLGSSVGVPESINQGTTIAPYYFAIPVATATLALTDRLAIRIYVNVDGRTVTLHTENSHLCQVVTTLSKGMVSLNNLTDQSQFITTGTSGTDFNIVSSGDTHTFNIPSASASNRGLITTGTQTIGGLKNFDAAINLKVGSGAGGTGYIGLGSITNNTLVVYNTTSGTTYSQSLAFPTTSAQTYTFPALNGTLALLEGTQTFSGAKTFSTFPTTFDAESIFNLGFQIKKITTGVSASAGYMAMYSPVGTANKIAFLDGDSTRVSTLTFDTTGSFSYTFPASSGTLALTSDLGSYVPYTGATGNVNLGSNNLTASNLFGETSLNVKILASGSAYSTGYSTFSTLAGKLTLAQEATAGNLKAFTFDFSAWATNSSYTYTLPSASGTIALTSDLSSYVPYTGATSAVDLGNYSLTTNNFIYGKAIQLDAGVEEVGGTVIFRQRAGISGGGANYTTIGAVDNNKLSFGFWQDAPSGVNRYKFFQFRVDNITISTSRVYQMPDADGTIALTSNLSSYVPYTGATADVNLGTTYSLSANNITAAGVVKSDFGLQLKSGLTTTISGYLSISAQKVSTNSQLNVYTDTGFYFSLIAPNTANYSYTYPASSGTLVLGTGTTNYLPKFTDASTIGNSVLYDNGTNVGLGTTSPNIGGYGANSRLLTIQGVSGSYGILELTSNSANADGSAIGRLDFGSDGQAANYKAISSIASFLSGSTSTKFGADLRFYTRANNAASGDPSERMRITRDGNVGIGTSSPDLTLTVNGAMNLRNSTRAGAFEIDSSGNLWMGTATTAGNLYFETGHSTSGLPSTGTPRMTITGGGNVGIGTSSPQSKLQVEGGEIRATTSNAGVAAYYTAGTGELAAYNWGGSAWIPLSYAGQYHIWRNSGNEVMRITSDGWVRASNTGSYITGQFHEFSSNLNNATTFRIKATSSTFTDYIAFIQADKANNSDYSFLQARSSNTSDTEFNLRGDGNAYADGSWNGGGADYAEYFEWFDGNPNNEDRRGYSVSLVGNKIKIAEKGETIIGVISGNPSVIGDSAWNMWTEKYLRDDFGTYVRDENGFRILNPNYNPDIDYISREERPEWGIVGLMGKLCMRKGQEVMPNWVKMKDVSDSVEQWLIK